MTADVEERARFRAARGRAGFDAIVPEWNALLRRMTRPRYFQLAEWYDAYLTALEPDESRVTFVACEVGSETVAIFPLRLRTTRVNGIPLRVLELPHHDHMPLADVIAEPGEVARTAFRQLWHWLRSGEAPRFDIIAFAPVLEDSAALSAVDVARHPAFVRPVAQCDSIDCDRSYDEMLASFSKNFRGNLRKARNKLEGSSGVVFESLADATLEQALAAFFDVEASGWKGREGEGTAISLHADLRRFYETLARRCAASGRLEINSLRVAGLPIASQFCVRLGDVCYVLKIGYDERYAQFAPGNMLLERRLREACADPGTREVNLVSDASWHQSWHPRQLGVRELFIAAPTLRGRVTLAALRLSFGARGRLAPIVRRVRDLRRKRIANQVSSGT